MNKYEENLCPIFRRKATSTDFFVRSSVKTAIRAVVGIRMEKKTHFIITCIIGGGSSSKGPIT